MSMPLPSEQVLQQEPLALQPLPPELWPNIDHIQTEDSAPVDNVYSEKQMRLLTEPLHSSWKPDYPFAAFANVGLFYGVNIPPLVPNMLLSLHVRLPEDLTPKLNRSYFVWGYGKPPEVATEIVSNKQGREDTEKLDLDSKARVSNYFIYDPECFISDHVLRGYQLAGSKLRPLQGTRFMLPDVGLGLSTWHGRYEDIDATWLRWTDADWNVIPTGAEAASFQTGRAEQAALRAEAATQLAESATRRANETQLENERLTNRLCELGIDP